MMNQQKSAKAGILKYSLIVPLVLVLVISSNAQTLIASAKTAISHISNKVLDTVSVNEQNTENKKVDENSIQQKEEVVISKDTQSTLIDSGKVKQIETQETNQPHVYNVVEKMPEFKGGVKALIDYLSQNLSEAFKNNKKGPVGVGFIINASGKVEKPKIILSVSPALDQEAINLVNSMPDWTPGELKGEKVPVQYYVYVPFPSKTEITALKNKSDEMIQKSKTLNPNYHPLVIIDGVQQPLEFDYKSSIKPETISSVSIIKPDNEEKKQELISKYGIEAADGVIQITTKK